MELTNDERSVLEGARGEYPARCMRWLVEWGDAMGARRMVLRLAQLEGKAPAAMVNLEVDALAALGCIVNQIPMLAELERDPFGLVFSGDRVAVDADAGTLTVLRRAK